MRMYDLIMKKRNGLELDEQEITEMINQYTAGSIPDYQMSAMMMAIYFRGMTEKETLYLTMAMTNSGDTLDLSGISGVKVDKHSTGGVGDKTSIALTPMVAACGVKVAKMSGRGLGHTGGTIDKLESFPGFSTGIEEEHFMKQVNEIGVSIMGQTLDLAPADKKLYALRDVTATVDNMSLIASSIMSKKLASGADAIVLDVKTGSGAFMKKEEDAFGLANEMVRLGNNAGRKTCALVTDMDQPLGNAVGNILEVKEAIDTLKGQGPEDFTTLCYELGARMLVLADKATDREDAIAKLMDVISSGKALDKLAEFVKGQGGDASYVYDANKFPTASIIRDVAAPTDGYIKKIVCDEIGVCSLILGGGRETKESVIDLTVGLVLHHKVGDFVKAGDSLATFYANDEGKLEAAEKRFLGAYEFSEEVVEKQPLIKGFVE